MKHISLSRLFSSFFAGKNAPTSFEKRLARIFVRRRLMTHNPALRGDPVALNKAYEELDLVVIEEENQTGIITYELMPPTSIPLNEP